MFEIASMSDERLGAIGMMTIPREDGGSPDGKRGRPRQDAGLMGDADTSMPANGDAPPETGLGADTSKLVARLRDQGLIKAEPAEAEGNPGHRTKNCRPVQVNMSEKMFRQLKVIAATQGLSIKEQIIHALVQQGYTE